MFKKIILGAVLTLIPTVTSASVCDINSGFCGNPNVNPLVCAKGARVKFISTGAIGGEYPTVKVGLKLRNGSMKIITSNLPNFSTNSIAGSALLSNLQTALDEELKVNIYDHFDTDCLSFDEVMIFAEHFYDYDQ
ncbi:hypothetical protein [Photobacterium damselae]|uniref:hypothetical protein n=1 Tax=Photobacterium damselae TaxID=38293 RepID=UPI0030F3F48C